MFAKLVALTLIMTVIYSGLLILRQERLDVMNESVMLHYQIMEGRKELWQVEKEIAERVRPFGLAEKLSQSSIVFEPAVPVFEHQKSRLAEKKESSQRFGESVDR